MAGRYSHNDKTEGDKPDRFPNNRNAKAEQKKTSGRGGKLPAGQGGVTKAKLESSGSGYGPGYGTGLGQEDGKRFGSGKQVDSGYGGEQYTGGNRNQAAGDPYGKPQPTRHNASQGSGTQYSAAKGKGPSPDGNHERARGAKKDKGTDAKRRE